QTAATLLDTDDAMRLAQLRGWLGGQGWFDLHQARIQPPEGYDTHWSRLIDAGLAGLLFLFGQFTDSVSAERLMRAWWPLLWLWRGVRTPLCGGPGRRRRSRFVWPVADGRFDRGLFRYHRGAALAPPFLRQHRGQHARRRDVRWPDAVAGRLAEA